MDKNLFEVFIFDAADYLETEIEIQDYIDEVSLVMKILHQVYCKP